MSVSSRLMLYGVADLRWTILFIPDPFRQLLRSSMRSGGSFIFQFLPVSAGQSLGHDDAACLRDVAFEFV
jgi:hypothetical protein